MWVLWATGLPGIGQYDTSPTNVTSACTNSTATPAVVYYGLASGGYTATVTGCEKMMQRSTHPLANAGLVLQPGNADEMV